MDLTFFDRFSAERLGEKSAALRGRFIESNVEDCDMRDY